MEPSYALAICLKIANDLNINVDPESQGPFDTFYRTGCIIKIKDPNGDQIHKISVQTDPRISGWAFCETLGVEPFDFKFTNKEKSLYGVIRFETPERFKEYLIAVKNSITGPPTSNQNEYEMPES